MILVWGSGGQGGQEGVSWSGEQSLASTRAGGTIALAPAPSAAGKNDDG